MPNSEDKFISGIHNYCDRWCERCSFTARCAVGEAESEMPDEERDINNDAFWRRLAANFAEAQMMLQQTAKELGIDLNAISTKQYAKHRKRQKELLDQEDLKKLANQYAKDSRQILEDKENWLIFSAPEQQIQAEMLSIIYWYQYFISVKSQRGLRGILDFDGNLDEEELTDSQ